MGTLSCQSLTRKDNENKKGTICDRLSTVILCQVIADKESMEEDLQRYISLNTYLDSEDPWFWQKLRYSLICIFHRTVFDHCKILAKTIIATKCILFNWINQIITIWEPGKFRTFKCEHFFALFITRLVQLLFFLNRNCAATLTKGISLLYHSHCHF